MATELPVILDSTKLAGADLRLKQYFFVKEHTDGTVILCAAATDKPSGVLQNQPNTDEPAQIMRLGITVVESGGTIAIGALLGTDANGKAAAMVPGTDTTKYPVGTNCDHVAGAAGTRISATINCLNPARGA